MTDAPLRFVFDYETDAELPAHIAAELHTPAGAPPALPAMLRV